MRVIGVVGESPYDTLPLIQVWNNQFKGKLKFEVVLQRIKGANLDSMGKMEKLLSAELKSKNHLDSIIFMRDLDGFRGDTQKTVDINSWFKRLSKISNCTNFLLINIQELEAFYWADISVINKHYKTKIKFSGNPESIENPKEKLTSETKKGNGSNFFQVMDNQMLIPKLDFSKVESKCEFYKRFLRDFKAYYKLS